MTAARANAPREKNKQHKSKRMSWCKGFHFPLIMQLGLSSSTLSSARGVPGDCCYTPQRNQERLRKPLLPDTVGSSVAVETTEPKRKLGSSEISPGTGGEMSHSYTDAKTRRSAHVCLCEDVCMYKISSNCTN